MKVREQKADRPRLTLLGNSKIRSYGAETDVRTWQRQYRLLQIALDGVAIILASGVTTTIGHYALGYLPNPVILVGLAVALLTIAAVFGAYAATWESGSRGTRNLLISHSFLLLALIAAVGDQVSLRRHLLLFSLIAIPMSAIGRVVGRIILQRQRRLGKWVHLTLIVGDESEVADLVTHFRRDREAGFLPIAALPTKGTGIHLERLGIPRLEGWEAIPIAVAELGVDTVAITPQSGLCPPQLRRVAWELEGTKATIVLVPGVSDVARSRVSLGSLSGLPLLRVAPPELIGYRRLVKGLFDRTVAALTLLFLLPALTAIYMAVRMTSRGPAIFRQTRVGKDGREFTMYKFRSMYADAEQRRIELMAAATDRPEGLLFKIREDPRVTRVGRFLRKFSLDELPQLVNVLQGSMSLVGPRPPLLEEVALYEDDVRRRLLVKPGLTGLWQISGRSDLTWEESVRLDLNYVENWSLTLDFLILWKTASALSRQRAAY